MAKPEIKGRGFIQSGKDIIETQTYFTMPENDWIFDEDMRDTFNNPEFEKQCKKREIDMESLNKGWVEQKPYDDDIVVSDDDDDGDSDDFFGGRGGGFGGDFGSFGGGRGGGKPPSNRKPRQPKEPGMDVPPRFKMGDKDIELSPDKPKDELSGLVPEVEINLDTEDAKPEEKKEEVAEEKSVLESYKEPSSILQGSEPSILDSNTKVIDVPMGNSTETEHAVDVTKPKQIKLNIKKPGTVKISFKQQDKPKEGNS